MAVVDTSTITQWLNQFGTTITTNISNQLNNMSYWINNASNSTRDALGNIINANFLNFNNLANGISSNISANTNFLYNAINSLVSRISPVPSFDLTTAINTINNVANAVNGSIGNVMANINNTINAYSANNTSVLQRGIDTISSLVNNISNSITSRISEPNVNIQNVISSVFGPLPNIIGQIVAAVGSTIGQINQSTRTDVNGALTAVSNVVRDVNGATSQGIKDALGVATNVYNTMSRQLVDQFGNVVRETLDVLAQPDVLELPDDFKANIADITASLKRAFPKDTSTDPKLEVRIPLVSDLIDAVINAITVIFGFLKLLRDKKFNNFDDVTKFLGLGDTQNISFITAFSGLILFFPSIAKIVSEMFGASAKQLELLANKQFTPNLPDIGTLIRLRLSGRFTDAGYKELAAKLGYDADNADFLLDASKNVPTPDTLFRAYTMRVISQNDFKAYMAKLGYSETVTDIFLYTLANPLGIKDYTGAWLRGDISESQLHKELTRHGILDEDIDTIKKLAYYVPPSQDLIRMSVREVFTPDLARKFGQFEDFPQEFLQYAKQQGISEFWAKNYWAAHWDLPSVSMGYEMFHKGIISEDDLKQLMKAQDIMPFWRDKLIKMSYNPITRVDIRRMYKLGIFDFNEVIRRYQDLGYSPDDAFALALFTIKYEAGDESDEITKIKELSQATIIKAYGNGIIPFADAINRLVELGYSENDANLLLRIKDFDKSIGVVDSVDTEFFNRTIKLVKTAFTNRVNSEAETINTLVGLGYTGDQAAVEVSLLAQEYDRKLKDRAIEIVKRGYAERTLDRNTVIALLNAFSVDGQEQQEVLAEIEAFRDIRIDKLSYAQVKLLYRQGIINDAEFIDELRGLGYAEKYVIWLARSEGIKI